MNKLLIFFTTLLICLPSFALEKDDIADLLPKNSIKSSMYLNYNYESTEKYYIKLKPINNIKSEKDIYEGQIINFKVAKDTLLNDSKILRRGTKASAKVSIIISPGMNGIPASIILNDFEIDGIQKNKLSNDYEIFGQDRSLMVYPLKWALTILPPTGSLTNFIMGGHAKIKTNKPIIINYYPKWI